MRIIAGKHKRRELLRVESEKTRETSDKVRESVFNILGPYFRYESVLDLFAGSGAYGIEALSRGALMAVFNDHQPKAVQTILANVRKIQAENLVYVTQKDYLSALKSYKTMGKTFDLVFLDPPYDLHVSEEVIMYMATEELLQNDATVVVEVEKHTQLPQHIAHLECVKVATYGIKKIAIYE